MVFGHSRIQTPSVTSVVMSEGCVEKMNFSAEIQAYLKTRDGPFNLCHLQHFTFATESFLFPVLCVTIMGFLLVSLEVMSCLLI